MALRLLPETIGGVRASYGPAVAARCVSAGYAGRKDKTAVLLTALRNELRSRPVLAEIRRDNEPDLFAAGRYLPESGIYTVTLRHNDGYEYRLENLHVTERIGV